MNDLDRLLKMYSDMRYCDRTTMDYPVKHMLEFKSLKAKIEGKMTNWDKYGKDYAFRIQTISNDKKYLESQVAKSIENSDYWQNKTNDKINEITKLKEAYDLTIKSNDSQFDKIKEQYEDNLKLKERIETDFATIKKQQKVIDEVSKWLKDYGYCDLGDKAWDSLVKILKKIQEAEE